MGISLAVSFKTGPMPQKGQDAALLDSQTCVMMFPMNGIFLTGVSGKAYFYTPYLWVTRWHPDPANYAFGWQDGETGTWRVAYLGETASLSHRMRNHGQWEAAAKLGCTHVLVNLNAGGQRTRRAEEQDLIAKYQPTLNSQHLKPSKLRAPRNGYYPTGW
jgi:hypothetical protein